MGLSAKDLAKSLGLAVDGPTGRYITEALELDPSRPDALPTSTHRGMLGFLRFVSQNRISSQPTEMIGDSIVEAYDKFIVIKCKGHSIWYARNACLSVVNLARSLAEADGHPVGPFGRKRPLRDARIELTAGTVGILDALGDLGNLLKRVLQERTDDGNFLLSNHEVPYARTFSQFCAQIVDNSKSKSTHALCSAILEQYQCEMQSRQVTDQYRQKCVRTAEKIIKRALAIAHGEGHVVESIPPIKLAPAIRKTASTTRCNQAHIDRMEQYGGLLRLVAHQLRAESIKLEAETIRSRLTNIAPLTKYLKETPSIVDFSHLTRNHLKALFDRVVDATHSPATKRNRWKSVKAVLTSARDHASQMDGKEYIISWPSERWLFQPSRKGNSDQGLNTMDAAKVERLAREEIEEVLARFSGRGPLFEGPYVEDLQAFELLLAFRTGFNPGTVRTLKLVDIREVGDNIEVSGVKLRARTQPLAVFAKTQTPSTGPWLLEKIRQVTSLARERAAPDLKDQLFLFERRRGPNRGHVQAFDARKVHTETKAGRVPWRGVAEGGHRRLPVRFGLRTQTLNREIPDDRRDDEPARAAGEEPRR